MPAPSTNRSPEGPGAKCCLGVAYFDRTLERKGIPPKCLGLGQLKNGDQSSDDVRQLTGSTGDFKYYCVGYSSHPTNTFPSRPGQPTQMPYCEGIEIAVTEERTQSTASAPASSRVMDASSASAATAGTLARDRAPAVQGPGNSSGGAPLPNATDASSYATAPTASASDAAGDHGGADGADADGAASSGPERGVRERFRRTASRNADSLLAVLRGEKLPTLPVQLKSYDSVAAARQALLDTASLNVEKMRAAVGFIGHRTVDTFKLAMERARSRAERGEEAE